MAYTLEVTGLLVAFGARDLLGDWMMVVDIIIVGCGWAETGFLLKSLNLCKLPQ